MLAHKLKGNPAFWKYRILYNEIFKIRGKNNKVYKEKLFGKFYIYIVGNNNVLKICQNVLAKDIPIHIRGNNNYIEIGDNVRFLGGNILCEGENNRIIIGAGTSIQSAHINAQEENVHITLGANCMLSEDIIIRTSDSHLIYDINTKERINNAKSVIIGNHVWMAARVAILKGCTIGDDSIIGVGSIVTHDIPANVIAAGIPAKVKRENVNWNKDLKGLV